jgi:hypothetical protein
VNEKFNNELRQIDGTLPEGHVYRLGMPEEALLASGLGNLPIELNADHLQRKSSQENHEFSLSDVKNLPEALANPIAIFDSTKKDGTTVILTELKKDNDNFVVAVRVWKEQAKRINRVEINSIRSLYPKDNATGIFDWINSKYNLLRWVDKKKAIDYIQTQSTNLIAGRDKTNGLRAAKIVQEFENPKNPKKKIRDGKEDIDESDRVGMQTVSNIHQNLKTCRKRYRILSRY